MSSVLTPAGDVSLLGKIHYHGTIDQPLLRNVWIDGNIGSEALVAASSEGRLELHVSGISKFVDLGRHYEITLC